MGRRDALEEAVGASGTLLAAAGSLSTARLGVAALALALGRACGAAGVDLDGAVRIARVAAEEAAAGGARGVLLRWAAARRVPEEAPS